MNMNWHPLPIASILVGSRLRSVDPATVANLMVAIGESGFTTAITVRTLDGEEGEVRYQLVAGAHRLAAMRALGHSVIPAVALVLTDDEAEQIEIDENLVRRGLTPLERAEMVLARQRIYARRWPDRVSGAPEAAQAKRGRPPKKSEILSDFLAGMPATMGFAADTAAEIGVTDRTIRHALEIVRGLPADLRAQLHGTPVAKNEGALRQLAAIGDKDEQAAVAAVLIKGETKNVADARAIAAGTPLVTPVKTAVDETLKALRKLMAAASPSAREAVYAELAGSISDKSAWVILRRDAPVRRGLNRESDRG